MLMDLRNLIILSILEPACSPVYVVALIVDAPHFVDVYQVFPITSIPLLFIYFKISVKD